MLEQPIITVFCAFTRPEMIQRWLIDLSTTDLDRARTNLAFIIDGTSKESDDPEKDIAEMYQILKSEAQTYRKWLITRNDEHRVNQVNIGIRRKRIAEMKNQSKKLIAVLDGDFVLSLEDDTVFTGLKIRDLLNHIDDDPEVGMVSGYQAGRWFEKMIGVWQFDDVKDPHECWTCLPSTGIEEVDGCGFYCYLTRKKLYLQADYYTEDWQPWGPDVNYGLWLRQQDYKVLVNWEVPLGHQDGETVILPEGNLSVENFSVTGQMWERRRQNG